MGIDAIDQLLKSGVPIDMDMLYGCTPLGFAILIGYSKAVVRPALFLIEKGVNTQLSFLGHSILSWCVLRREYELVEAILETGLINKRHADIRRYIDINNDTDAINKAIFLPPYFQGIHYPTRYDTITEAIFSASGLACQNGITEKIAQVETQDHTIDIVCVRIAAETAGRAMDTDCYSHGQKQIKTTFRQDDIYWLDKSTPFPEVHFYLDAMQHMIAFLNQHLFLSLFEYESHFALYKPGAFYKRHRDQFQGTSSRQISCVYYLNPDWQAKDGGELVLYGQDNHSNITLLPKGNRLVCFRSHIEHEVLITHKNRLSITSWLKTRA